MANWREKIELNQTLNRVQESHDLSRFEEPCPDEVKSALATELEKSVWLKRHGARIRGADSIAEVNRILANVYDDADRHLVWCGM
jgi:hypothetical protein